MGERQGRAGRRSGPGRQRASWGLCSPRGRGLMEAAGLGSAGYRDSLEQARLKAFGDGHGRGGGRNERA
jgi:hypothetical protein